MAAEHESLNLSWEFLLILHFFVAESNLFTYLADGGLLRFAGQGLSRFVEVGSYGLYVGVPIVNDDGNDVVGPSPWEYVAARTQS